MGIGSLILLAIGVASIVFGYSRARGPWARYQDALGLSAYDAAVLAADADAGRLFEATLASGGNIEPKPVANWVIGDYLRLRNAAADPISVDPAALATLVQLVADGTLNQIGRAHV